MKQNTLNQPRIKEEFTREVRKRLTMNEKENLGKQENL